MTLTRLIYQNGWIFPVNEKGERNWLCPKCGHEHTSCCGNSHFPCKQSAQYGGKCNCTYVDSLGSMDYIWSKLYPKGFPKSDDKILFSSEPNVFTSQKVMVMKKAKVNRKKCTGCMACVQVCPVEAITMEDKR